MLADIACAQRPQNRIGQGVQPDIRVGMAEQALVMRYRDAAQGHMVAGTEAMHVEAGADPQFALGRCSSTGFCMACRQLGAGEILRRRELAVVLAADRKSVGEGKSV